jgi:3-oxoacyl-[acyl-carrier-protein] synthase-3
MLSAIDVASRLLLSNPRLNKALVVGSFLGSFISSKNDPVCYSNLADASAAIVLEKVEEPQKRGFIDTNFKTDPSVKDAWRYPICGFKQLFDDNVDKEDKKLKMKPFDTSFICQEWVNLMDTLFNRCDVSKYAISQYFFSQFSKPDAEKTLQLMQIDLERFTFTGDKYGYTGLTSPILAYYEALSDGKIHSGDNIMFCSVGAGFNICALLYKM